MHYCLYELLIGSTPFHIEHRFTSFTGFHSPKSTSNIPTAYDNDVSYSG